MSKRAYTRRIKKHTTYTVIELAEETGATEQTVRRWINEGLPTIDAQRPTLIIGQAASEFLKARQAKAKQPMAIFELRCMSCKAPRAPFGMMADYTPQSPAGGRLNVLCDTCERPIFRNVSASQLPELHQYLDIKTRGSKYD